MSESYSDARLGGRAEGGDQGDGKVDATEKVLREAGRVCGACSKEKGIPRS